MRQFVDRYHLEGGRGRSEEELDKDKTQPEVTVGGDASLPVNSRLELKQSHHSRRRALEMIAY